MHGKDLDPAAPPHDAAKSVRRTTPPDLSAPRRIEPFPFEPAHQAPPVRASSYRLSVSLLAAALLAVLLYSLWFVFTARQLRLDIQPEPDRVDLQGAWLTPQLRGYYLLRPGTYHIRAVKTGYTPLATDVVVANQDRQTLTLTLEKLPGRLDISAHEAGQPDLAIERARVFIDGSDAGVTPLKDRPVPAGEHQLRIEADLYRPLETPLTVEGMEHRQGLTYALTPDYAQVTVSSDPPEAVIQVDGVRQGLTPATLAMAAGPRQLELQHPGYKPWTRTVPVTAGSPLTLETAVLAPLDGRLVVNSQPEGASVMVGTRYHGQTPLTIDLPPDRSHKVQLSKAGYAPAAREVTVRSGEETALQVELAAAPGHPLSARRTPGGHSPGGRPRPGPGPGDSSTLLAVPHRIEIRKEGFTPIHSPGHTPAGVPPRTKGRPPTDQRHPGPGDHPGGRRVPPETDRPGPLSNGSLPARAGPARQRDPAADPVDTAVLHGPQGSQQPGIPRL